MGRPVVAPPGDSSKCAPYGASCDDFRGGGSGGIGLAGGASSPVGSQSNTLGAQIE